MKKHLTQLLIIIPLILIAGGAFAAYSFIGPTGAPTSSNTDGPLDVSTTDQIKNDGLAVNAFQSQAGSDFMQQVSFAGLVNGGTSADTDSAITFGSSSNKTSVSNVGNTAIVGNYQSDSLITKDGKSDPLCADKNGTFYVCGGSTTPPNTYPIYLSLESQFTDNNINFIGAHLSEPLNHQTEVDISMSKVGTSTGTTSSPAALNYIKNNYTALADEGDTGGGGDILDDTTGDNSGDSGGVLVGGTGGGGGGSGGGGSTGGTGTPSSGVCKEFVGQTSNKPVYVGSVTIYADSVDSWNTVTLPPGCDISQVILSISSYKPSSDGNGRPVVATAPGMIAP